MDKNEISNFKLLRKITYTQFCTDHSAANFMYPPGFAMKKNGNKYVENYLKNKIKNIYFFLDFFN